MWCGCLFGARVRCSSSTPVCNSVGVPPTTLAFYAMNACILQPLQRISTWRNQFQKGAGPRGAQQIVVQACSRG